MSKLYVAYGSNLNHEQMLKRCKGATFVGTTEIKDHYLLFRGSRDSAVATIEPREGSTVLVGLWEIDEQHELSLDCYEGYPTLYHKKDISIDLHGVQERAMVYVMDQRYAMGLPSEIYYNCIQQGYEDCGLDIEKLEDAVREETELLMNTQGQSLRQM